MTVAERYPFFTVGDYDGPRFEVCVSCGAAVPIQQVRVPKTYDWIEPTKIHHEWHERRGE